MRVFIGCIAFLACTAEGLADDGKDVEESTKETTEFGLPILPQKDQGPMIAEAIVAYGVDQAAAKENLDKMVKAWTNQVHSLLGPQTELHTERSYDSAEFTVCLPYQETERPNPASHPTGARMGSGEIFSAPQCPSGRAIAVPR